MPERPTDDLLAELTGDLEAVTPIPPVRRTLSLVMAGLAAAVAVSAMLGFPAPGFAPGIPWSSPAFLALFAGLAAVAAGGLAAGLAGAVPGRDAVVRLGVRVAGVGALLIVATVIALALQPGGLAPRLPLAATLACLARAVALAVVPALVACVAVARAFDVRQRSGAVWTCVGAGALGALVVHATCAATGAAHVLLGHVVEPALVAVAIGALLGPLLRAKLPATR